MQTLEELTATMDSTEREDDKAIKKINERYNVFTGGKRKTNSITT